MESSHAKSDVHARITDEIIKAIEAGVSTCEMPWHGGGGMGMPENPVTKKPYNGVNVLALWASGRNRGYTLPYWATYRQWHTLGARRDY